MPHKLLLADDSVTIQKVIELTFADEDIQVVAVSDGRAAIERATVEKPDIVLADVGMPERDGYEVAAFIKSTPELAHVPVLLLTGAFEPIDEDRARAAGCDGVLVKPFEPQMVISRVKDLIAGRPPANAGPSTSPFDLTAALPAPRPPAQPAASTDAYFDRLDAVFSRESELPAPRRAPDGDAPGTLSAEMAGWHPEAAASQDPDVPSPPPEVLSRRPADPLPATPTLAQAFAALLAAEQGKVAPLQAAPAADEIALRDDVVDAVTRRVIDSLADNAVRDIVLDVAERLVREEIARIKGR